MTTAQAEKITDEIMELYKGYGGNEYAGEKVTQLEHMAQTAQLAEEQGFDEEVILAAFLHDIGHISEAAAHGVANGGNATTANAAAHGANAATSGANAGANGANVAVSGANAEPGAADHAAVAEDDSRRMGAFGIRDHEELGAEFLREKGFSKKVCRLVESHVEAKRYLTTRDPGYYAQLSEASKKTLEYQGGPMTSEEAAAFEQYPLFSLIIQMRKWDEQAKIEHKPLPDLQHYRRMMLRHLLNS